LIKVSIVTISNFSYFLIHVYILKMDILLFTLKKERVC